MNKLAIDAGGLELEVCHNPCTYEPAEDSLLAVETIKLAARHMQHPRLVVDLGTGTGLLALAASKLLKPGKIVAVDINPYAVKAAECTLKDIPGSLVVRCNGLNCINETVDLIISNPPYLDVEDSLPGECADWLAKSWGRPRLLYRLCNIDRTVARCILAVYSTLSPIDLEKCLEERGFRVVERLASRFFMEELRAILMCRGDPSG